MCRSTCAHTHEPRRVARPSRLSQGRPARRGHRRALIPRDDGLGDDDDDDDVDDDSRRIRLLSRSQKAPRAARETRTRFHISATTSRLLFVSLYPCSLLAPARSFMSRHANLALSASSSTPSSHAFLLRFRGEPVALEASLNSQLRAAVRLNCSFYVYIPCLRSPRLYVSIFP